MQRAWFFSFGMIWVVAACGARTGIDDGGDPPPTTPTIDPSSIESARPVAPLSTQTTATRTPTFRWVLPKNTDAAEIELCADRACTTSLAKVQTTGDHLRLPSPLASRVVFWRLRGVRGGVVGTKTSATWELFTSARDVRDTASGSVPDFDGDGLADWVLGAFGAGNDAGKVEIFHSQASSPSAVIEGEDNAELGTVFGTIGDIDGDGFPELAVGSQLALTIYAGGPNGVGTKMATFYDGAAPDSVGSVGDLDGDGYGDFFVANGASSLMIHYGAPKGMTRTTTIASPITSDITYATSGDLDGDGRPDVCVGFVFATMSVFDAHVLVSMNGNTPIEVPVEPSPAFLAHVDCGADVDGDGFADLAVSYVAADADTNDLIDVYRGGPNGFAKTPTQTRFPMQYGMDAAEKGPPITFGDFDGDGRDDLVAGLVGRRLQIVPGSASGLDISQTRILALPDAPDGLTMILAPTVANGGDVNGDGIVDLVAGAQGYWEGEPPNQVVADVGHAWIYSGGKGGLTASSTPFVALAGPGDDQLTFGCDVQ
jgi:hypothetical protein